MRSAGQALTPPPVQYARTGSGGHVAYQAIGEGELVVLAFREWGASVDSVWEHPAHLRFTQHWAELARCVYFDPRGAGVSDPVPLEEVGDLASWVEDGVAVMEAVGAERAYVFGEGYGTHAATIFTVRHPELVWRLSLANTYPTLRRTPDTPYGLTGEALNAAVENVRQAWGSGSVIYGTVPGLGSDESFRDFCASNGPPPPPEVAAHWVRAAFTSDVTRELGEITVPTLVLHTGDLRHVPLEASTAAAALVPGARYLQTDQPNFYWFDDPEISRELHRFILGDDQDHPLTASRELGTVLFTDLVGSTARATQLGDEQWTQELAGIDGFVERTVARFGGRLVKQTGDGHLAIFGAPTDALRAALALRHGVRALGVETRIGVHTGEVEVRANGDLSGIAVHIAARVMDVGQPGEVLTTEAIPMLVAGSGFSFADRGTHELKGVADPWRLLALIA